MTVSDSTFAQLVGLCAAILLLCGVLLVWRRSLRAQIRLLSAQGWTLGALVLVLGVRASDLQLVAIALLVGLLKGIVLPRVITRATVARGDALREETPLINTTSSLILVALLTTLAYLVSQPMRATESTPTVAAVPVGIAMALFGFLLLTTRRHAISQLIGFLLLDNGISAVAFLTADGVPLVVELGVSLDVLLVVLILQVLTSRIRVEFGAVDLDDLKELRD
jgi:hydrogenase-4 component E